MNENIPRIITVDGPAASGKGTVAKKLAEYLDYCYLDTGKLYRRLALHFINNGNDIKNEESISLELAEKNDEILASLSLNVDDKNLISEKIGFVASVISQYQSVREALLEFQRDFAKRPPGAVLDGRDTGTIICPDADLKLFITAEPEIRAKRRYEQLLEKSHEVEFDEVLLDIQKRDEADKKRDIAPLIPAEDAIIIDSGAINADQIIDDIKSKFIRKNQK